MTALKLASLHLEGYPLVRCGAPLEFSQQNSSLKVPVFLDLLLCFQEEASFMKAAMDKVQSSYLRSLQEVGDLLKKRAETIKNLKIWTPSHTSKIKTCTPMPPSVSPPAPIEVRGKPQHWPGSLQISHMASVSSTWRFFFFFFNLLFDTHLWTVATLIAHKLVSKHKNLYGSCHSNWKGWDPFFKKKYHKLGDSERSGCFRGA